MKKRLNTFPPFADFRFDLQLCAACVFFPADPADGGKKAHEAQLLRSTSQTRFNRGWPQRCSAATEAMFRLCRAGIGEPERGGVSGNRRREFLTIRRRYPRLHCMRFLTNVGAVFPDEGHPALLG
jgi:hypothetical protein